MQLFSVDATMFSNYYENMKKPALKVAHSRPKLFFPSIKEKKILYYMQLFSADATMFLKKIKKKKNCP